MDAIQKARTDLGKPISFTSAHRCSWHNARVGGAPLSQHKLLALDIPLQGHDPKALQAALKRAGFKGFGYYETFIHVDMGRVRFWSQNTKVKLKWRQILSD